jgi:pilus assembly protein Flp/PilA
MNAGQSLSCVNQLPPDINHALNCILENDRVFYRHSFIARMGALLLFRLLNRLLRDEDGATAIEYGLIAILISVVATSTIGMIGSWVSSTFSGFAADL